MWHYCTFENNPFLKVNMLAVPSLKQPQELTPEQEKRVRYLVKVTPTLLPNSRRNAIVCPDDQDKDE